MLELTPTPSLILPSYQPDWLYFDFTVNGYEISTNYNHQYVGFIRIGGAGSSSNLHITDTKYSQGLVLMWKLESDAITSYRQKSEVFIVPTLGAGLTGHEIPSFMRSYSFVPPVSVVESLGFSQTYVDWYNAYEPSISVDPYEFLGYTPYTTYGGSTSAVPQISILEDNLREIEVTSTEINVFGPSKQKGSVLCYSNIATEVTNYPTRSTSEAVHRVQLAINMHKLKAVLNHLNSLDPLSEINDLKCVVGVGSPGNNNIFNGFSNIRVNNSSLLTEPDSHNLLVPSRLFSSPFTVPGIRQIARPFTPLTSRPIVRNYTSNAQELYIINIGSRVDNQGVRVYSVSNITGGTAMQPTSVPQPTYSSTPTSTPTVTPSRTPRVTPSVNPFTNPNVNLSLMYSVDSTNFAQGRGLQDIGLRDSTNATLPGVTAYNYLSQLGGWDNIAKNANTINLLISAKNVSIFFRNQSNTWLSFMLAGTTPISRAVRVPITLVNGVPDLGIRIIKATNFTDSFAHIFAPTLSSIPGTTPTLTRTPAISQTARPAFTNTPTSTPTRTPGVTPSSTKNPPGVTASRTPNPTPTKTPRATTTGTPYPTPTRTPRVTPSPTRYPFTTSTPVYTQSATRTPIPTSSVTPTPYETPTVTPTSSVTPTPSSTEGTVPPVPSSTATATPTPTVTKTVTPTVSPTATSPVAVTGPQRGTDGSVFNLRFADDNSLTGTSYRLYTTKFFKLYALLQQNSFTPAQLESTKDALDYWSYVLRDTVLPIQTQPDTAFAADFARPVINPLKGVVDNNGYILFLNVFSENSNVLGSAAFFFTRNAETDKNNKHYQLPSMGTFLMNSVFINNPAFQMTAPTPLGKNEFYYTVLHEVGHLLGLGSNWYRKVSSTKISKSFIVGAGDTSPNPNNGALGNIFYSIDRGNGSRTENNVGSSTTGVRSTKGDAAFTFAFNPDTPIGNTSAAVTAYNACFNTSLTAIPVEHIMGTGSYGGHWCEGLYENQTPETGDARTFYSNSIPGAPALQDELMTPISEGRLDIPVSRVTLGSLQDMGWTVDINHADVYEPLVHRVKYIDNNNTVLGFKKHNFGAYIDNSARALTHLRRGLTYTFHNETGDELIFAKTDFTELHRSSSSVVTWTVPADYSDSNNKVFILTATASSNFGWRVV